MLWHAISIVICISTSTLNILGVHRVTLVNPEVSFDVPFLVNKFCADQTFKTKVMAILLTALAREVMVLVFGTVR